MFFVIFFGFLACCCWRRIGWNLFGFETVEKTFNFNFNKNNHFNSKKKAVFLLFTFFFLVAKKVVVFHCVQCHESVVRLCYCGKRWFVEKTVFATIDAIVDVVVAHSKAIWKNQRFFYLVVCSWDDWLLMNCTNVFCLNVLQAKITKRKKFPIF